MATVISPVIAGTAVTTTATFTTAGGTVTDPDTIVLKFQAGGGSTTTWTYGGTGSITKTSTGVYAATLDTTGIAGTWIAEWIGTGACAAVSVAQFQVNAQSI